ncbi:MAG TPA: hypothetical protein VF721_06930 [Pyrinomonadaceae bacterium]|jgi:hypothetical protein
MSDAGRKPVKIILRSYQVGFGDCFLLTFNYGDKDDRHVLIDFGSTGLPKEFEEKQAETHMLEVAEQIRRDCNKKLHVVVATHRHKDHISGFSTTGEKNADGETTGSIISSCKPDMVIQPWTENPNLDDKTVKESAARKMISNEDFKAAPEKSFAATLLNMQRVAGLIKVESNRLGTTVAEAEDDTVGFTHPLDDKTKKQLFFMGDNNVANESAVMNLRAMGAKAAAHFVAFGDRIGLSQVLPGVKVRILGPPTLKQHHEIIKQRSRDDEEFWMFHSMAKNFWGMQALTADLVEDLNERENDMPDRLFPKAKVYQNFAPSETRWFIRQVRTLRADQLLGLVRILDKALNNTSVILLFEIGDKKLLFPGDAQIENWEYALSKPEIRKLLRETTLYKVGHHGSRNATPKTLWNDFKNRSTDDKKDDRLKTVVSTMPGKHGHTEQTAVPRRTLVNELEKLSEYHTTQNIKNKSETDGWCEKIVIKL